MSNVTVLLMPLELTNVMPRHLWVGNKCNGSGGVFDAKRSGTSFL